MARYDHLPIYRAAFDLAVHLKQIVRHFDCRSGFTASSTDVSKRVRRVPQVPVRLQAHPELRRHLEKLREPECGIGRDAPLAVDDFVQPIERNLHALRRYHLRQPSRSEKLLKQHVARRCRWALQVHTD